MLQAKNVGMQCLGCNGLGVTLPDSATPTETQLVVDALNQHNQRIFKITIISTLVVGVAAALNSWRVFKQLQRDEAREKAIIRKLQKR